MHKYLVPFDIKKITKQKHFKIYMNLDICIINFSKKNYLNLTN